MVQKAVRIVQKAFGQPCRIFQNCFSDTETVAHPNGQGYCPDARARDSIFFSNYGL
jgi:hypothetical protein